MIQATVDEAYHSLVQVRQELGELAKQLGADWFRLHDLLPLLEAVATQRAALQLTQATDPLFRAFLVLQQAEARATALQRQLEEAQSWLQQAEEHLAHWGDQPR